ncbi:MAG: hypothetical protein ABR586_05540 [Thermoplasmatota archaeon]
MQLREPHQDGDGGVQAGLCACDLLLGCPYIESNIGSRGVNGGSVEGIGLLVDGAGFDHYSAGIGASCSFFCNIGGFGVNGGAAYGGVALLLDGGGDDQYLAGVNVSCSHCGVGVVGANGGSYLGGIGRLFDFSGDDYYLAGVNVTCSGDCFAGSFGANGGSSFGGSAILLDSIGDDFYEAGVDASFSCYDEPWFDITVQFVCLVGSEGANGGGFLGGNGALIDGSGNDVYLGGIDSTATCSVRYGSVQEEDLGIGSLGVNGGATFGSGRLLDAGGTDAYEAGFNSTFSCSPRSGYAVITFVGGVGQAGANGGTGASLGSGLLLDSDGSGDLYQDGEGGSGTDKTVLEKGWGGAQIDSIAGIGMSACAPPETVGVHVDGLGLCIPVPPVGTCNPPNTFGILVDGIGTCIDSPRPGIEAVCRRLPISVYPPIEGTPVSGWIHDVKSALPCLGSLVR